MNITVALLILIIVILVIILGVVLYNKFANKWKCTENGCEKDWSGDHPSKEVCASVCSEKPKMIQPPVQQVVKPTGYACTNNYQCVESNNGDYTTMDACTQNCKAPEPNYYPTYPAYYPTSLLQWKPRRWGPERRWSPRRGGRGRR